MDPIEQLSSGLADRIAAAASFTVGIHTGKRPTSGILWRPDVIVASEQMLPNDAKTLQVTRGGVTAEATLAGRDPSTNVAVLKLGAPLDGTLPGAAQPVRVGDLTLVVGADAKGDVTARLAMVHALGDAWYSLAGGRIDALIRLQTPLGVDEGGPVLSLGGGLIGIARGWLGVGLQPVVIPDSVRQTSGRDSGLMVVAMAGGGPAETAGVLPGDIVLDIDGTPAGRPRSLTASLGSDRIGQPVALRVLRAGAVQTISVTIGARPPT
jgi:S1-C subfamily serine protease